MGVILRKGLLGKIRLLRVGGGCLCVRGYVRLLAVREGGNITTIHCRHSTIRCAWHGLPVRATACSHRSVVVRGLVLRGGVARVGRGTVRLLGGGVHVLLLLGRASVRVLLVLLHRRIGGVLLGRVTLMGSRLVRC